MHNLRQDAIRSTRSAIAANDLPALMGSPQQIEWAQNIRIDLLVAANALLAQLNALVRVGSLLPAQRDEAFRTTLRLREARHAAWWIAHRDCTVAEVLRELSTRSYALESGGEPSTCPANFERGDY